jgi:16S rRNA G966 N2-methylase RsmD
MPKVAVNRYPASAQCHAGDNLRQKFVFLDPPHQSGGFGRKKKKTKKQKKTKKTQGRRRRRRRRRRKGRKMGNKLHNRAVETAGATTLDVMVNKKLT